MSLTCLEADIKHVYLLIYMYNNNDDNDIRV